MNKESYLLNPDSYLVDKESYLSNLASYLSNNKTYHQIGTINLTIEERGLTTPSAPHSISLLAF